MLNLQAQSAQTSTFPFDAGDMLQIIQQLEQESSDLAQANAVDLSIQNADAENVLAEVSRHFGDRLSSKPATYRLPNDLWYHIDFTPNWNRKVLFENAPNKLVHGGHFVLISDADVAERPETTSLELVFDRIFAIGERRVHAWVFKS
jgi:hypothetical protein